MLVCIYTLLLCCVGFAWERITVALPLMLCCRVSVLATRRCKIKCMWPLLKASAFNYCSARTYEDERNQSLRDRERCWRMPTPPITVWRRLSRALTWVLLLQEGKKKAKFDKEYCLRFAALYFGPLKNDMVAYAERDVNGAKAAGGAGLPKFVQKTSAPASDSSLYQVCPLPPPPRSLQVRLPHAPRYNPRAWLDGALYSRGNWRHRGTNAPPLETAWSGSTCTCRSTCLWCPSLPLLRAG